MTETADVDFLTSLIAGVTELGADLKIGLNLNITPPSKRLTVSDMLEPTYTGYSRQLAVMGAPFRDTTDEICALASPLTFQQSGTPVPCLVQGYFVMGGTGSNVFMGYEPLETPFQMNDTLDSISIQLQWIQSSQRQGFGIIVT